MYKETIRTFSNSETNKNKSKLKQINFEEAVQMMFYKKFTSKHSTKHCNYSNTNQYIYITLINENANLDKRNNNLLCEMHEKIANQNFVADYSSKELTNQKLFYNLSEKEQIIWSTISWSSSNYSEKRPIRNSFIKKNYCHTTRKRNVFHVSLHFDMHSGTVYTLTLAAHKTVRKL